VAQKKRKKRHWFRSLVFFVMTPLTVWALAFLIWLYWGDITRLFNPGANTPPAKASKEVERSTKPSDKTAQEGIGEEDRKKLDDILKNKK
jgi:hypothetical protein